MKSKLTLVLLLTLSLYSFSQQAIPSIEWSKCFGGSSQDKAYAITQTTDGHFVFVGETWSNDGDVTGHTSDTSDAWVVKIDIGGNILWQKTFGGSQFEVGRFITATPDGGTIFAAQSASNNGDVSGNHGGGDVWIVKLDRNGTLEWQKCYGGSSADVPRCIRTTSDGGYIFIGYSLSNNGDLSANLGSSDVWVVKIDATGTMQWQKNFGNINSNLGEDIQQLPGGGYVITVQTDGMDGDFPGAATGPYGFVAKLDANGNLQEKKQLSNFADPGTGVLALADNRFMTINTLTLCYPAAITMVVRGSLATYNAGAWSQSNPAVFGVCSAFNQPLTHRVQGPGSMATPGSDIFYVGGYTDDTAGNANKGGFDGFIARFTADGSAGEKWKKQIGGSGTDQIMGVLVTGDNETIAIGFTNSNNQDVSGNHSANYDVWVVKLGKANTIKGTVFRDMNGNGIKDANEGFAENVLVKSTKPGREVSSPTFQGVFNNFVDTGNYTTALVNVPQYYTVTPASNATNFTTFGNVDSMSFALQPITGKRDYLVTLAARTPARPGFRNDFSLHYQNVGTDTLTNRVVTLILDSALNYLNAYPTAPTSISGDTLRWNIPTLMPYQVVYLAVETVADIPPALNINDTIETKAMIDTTGDVNKSNNEASVRQRVFGSYDPNDKQEAHGGFITPAELSAGKPLVYTIRFQNTGNDTAFSVVIRDTLPANTDWSSFEMVQASHPYTLTITDGRYAKWTFANILLVDSNRNEPLSHGYLTFRIKAASTVAIGDKINNSASIYFDFNPPVITNTTETAVKPEPPSTPVITGLQPAYCNTTGVTTVRITNLPAVGSGVTVTVKIDANTVGVGADSTFSFNVSTLAAGAHSISVQFSNSGGNRLSSAGFNVTEAVTPDVNVLASITNITNLATPVIITATNAAGGGTGPLYTFARDRNFTNISQAESVNNTWTFDPSILAIGDNMIYIRMKSNASCVVANTVTDSVLLKRSSVTGINDPDMPGQVINIYPNPFRDVIMIKGLSAAKIYTVTLYNLEGKQILSRRVSNRSAVNITRQHQATGTYWLSIYDEKRKQLLGTVKLLKQ